MADQLRDGLSEQPPDEWRVFVGDAKQGRRAANFVRVTLYFSLRLVCGSVWPDSGSNLRSTMGLAWGMLPQAKRSDPRRSSRWLHDSMMASCGNTMSPSPEIVRYEGTRKNTAIDRERSRRWGRAGLDDYAK